MSKAGYCGMLAAAAIAGSAAEAVPSAAVHRVATYNIHVGVELGKEPGAGQAVDMSRIADTLKRLDCDLIGLNEVDVNCRRSGNLDQPEILSRHLGMGVVFAHARAIDMEHGYADQGPVWGGYGVAALSKKPLQVMLQAALPLPETMEPRTVLIVRTREAAPIYFIVTHLPWEKDAATEALRVKCLKYITALVRQNHYTPAVFTGDLNAEGDSETLRYLRSEWQVVGDEQAAPTFPADHPRKRLDYIAFLPREAFTVVDCQVIPETIASDHRPVLATLRRNP